MKNYRDEEIYILVDILSFVFVGLSLYSFLGVVNQYLNGDYEKIQDFCVSSGVDIKKFKKYVDIIKDSEEELYNKYIEQRDHSYYVYLKAKKEGGNNE